MSSGLLIYSRISLRILICSNILANIPQIHILDLLKITFWYYYSD